MERIDTLIAYCKKNGGKIMFPQPLHLRLTYRGTAGEPDLLGLEIIDEELYVIDLWRNYTEPKSRILRYLYSPLVETVCDYAIRWLERNIPTDRNLF